MSSGGYIRTKADATWWMQQIHRGIKYRKKEAYQDQWMTWRKYYKGEWKPGVLPVNLFYRMARTVVPRVYFRNPSVSITPSKPGMLNWAFAQLLERVDNKLIRKMKLKNKMKSAVQKTWFFGTGPMKVGFGTQYAYDATDFGGEAPKVRGRISVDYNQTMGPNMPWVSSVHPGNFIIPDGLIEYEETPWWAEWVRRPSFDVRNDGRLKGAKDLRPSGRAGIGDRNHEFRIPEDNEMIDLVEIHDLRTGQVIVLAPFSTDRVLLQAEDPLMFHGITNTKVMRFNEVDNSFWGLPDAQILDPEQREMNEIRTLMMYHWRLSVVKLLYQDNSIDLDEIQKLIDGEVFGAIKVKGKGALDNIVKFIESGGVPDSLILADRMIAQDTRESMGFSRNEAGEFNPASSRTSATEVQVVKQASEIRVDERRDVAADVLVEIIEHMNRVIFQEWTQEQVIDIAGPAGIPLWVKFRPAMLREGSYDVKVDPDTSIPMTKEVRSSQAVALYGILKDNPLIAPERLTRYLLHELHGVQFDDMMRGMPPGLGGPTDAIDLEQYVQVMAQIAQKAPELLANPQALPGPSPEVEPNA